MEKMELISFEIISIMGAARSMFIEAIYEARDGDFEKADQLLEEGNKTFITGHKIHAEMIQNEAKGNKTEISLLLIHAEDQLMSAEAFGILAEEFVRLYKRLDK